MDGESIVIAGEAAITPCVRKASHLMSEVYEHDRAAHHPSSLVAAFDASRPYWEKLWERDTPEGLKAAFYAPVGAKENPKDFCPPALVFRGSDATGEDFEELAIAFQFQGRLLIEETFRDEVPADLAFGPFDTSASIKPEFSGKTMNQMRASGLMEKPLVINQTGRVDIDLYMTGVVVARGALTWTFSASLFYGTRGDWPTNAAQAFGDIVPPQYTSAIKIAKEAAEEAASTYGNRIFVTGHSLGGGLAAAAAVAIRSAHPDMEIKCVTYNPAGLHEKTAELAGGNLDTGSSIPVFSLQVRGDILSSLQDSGHIEVVPIFWTGPQRI